MTTLADILHDEDVDAAYHAEMEADQPFDNQLTGEESADIASLIASVPATEEYEPRRHNGRLIYADVDENNTIYHRYLDTLEKVTP